MSDTNRLTSDDVDKLLREANLTPPSDPLSMFRARSKLKQALEMGESAFEDIDLFKRVKEIVSAFPM